MATDETTEELKDINLLVLHESVEEAMRWGVRYRITRVATGWIYIPIRRVFNGNDEYLSPVFVPHPELSKREHFAALAMAGLCANSVPGRHHLPENLAKEAVMYADATLLELSKPQP